VDVSLGTKIDKIFQLRFEKANLENQVKEINAQIDQLSWEAIGEMEKLGVDKVASNLGTATRKVDLYPRVEDKDSFVNWCTEHGRFDMATMSVNRAVFKQHFDESNDYPEGVDAYEKATLNFRKK
jgi:hypothetical protein